MIGRERIAITGVTGFIGRHLATRALERGPRRDRVQPAAVDRAAVRAARRPALPRAPRAARSRRARTASTRSCTSRSRRSRRPTTVIDSVNRLGTERMIEAAKAVRRRALRLRVVAVGARRRRVGVRPVEARGRAGVRGRARLRDRAAGHGVRRRRRRARSPRTTRTAAKLRVFPVIGGDAARVQPIDVDELCDALIALATMSDPPRSVMLGDPVARPLGDFVRSEAQKHHGVAPRPDQRVDRCGPYARCALASRLHLPSPISEANVDGIEAFEPMDTAADVALMARIVRDDRAGRSCRPNRSSRASSSSSAPDASAWCTRSPPRITSAWCSRASST